MPLWPGGHGRFKTAFNDKGRKPSNLFVPLWPWGQGHPKTSLDGLEAFWCFTCVATGVWVMVLPFLREFQAQADLTEAKELAASVEKISSVDAVAKQIENATEQWLHVEDRANEINAASREIAGKINAESSPPGAAGQAKALAGTGSFR